MAAPTGDIKILRPPRQPSSPPQRRRAPRPGRSERRRARLRESKGRANGFFPRRHCRRRRRRSAGDREGPGRQLPRRHQARREAGPAPEPAPPLQPQVRRRGGQVRRQERLLRPGRHRQHHRPVGPLRLRRRLPLQPSPEQVLRDVRGAVHEEGAAAEVPDTGRRFHHRLPRLHRLRRRPPHQEGAAAAAQAGPPRQDLKITQPNRPVGEKKHKSTPPILTDLVFFLSVAAAAAAAAHLDRSISCRC